MSVLRKRLFGSDVKERTAFVYMATWDVKQKSQWYRTLSEFPYK